MIPQRCRKVGKISWPAGHRREAADGSITRRLVGIVSALLLVALSAVPAYPASLHDVVISEIAWMGTTTSEHDEWIELYNNTSSPIDLTGWTLTAADGTPNISLGGTIPAGGYFLLERSDDDSVPGVAADQIYAGALENDGEDLALRDVAPDVIDQVDCSSEWFAGHGDGRIPMVRRDTLSDGNLASNWTHNPRCGTATNSAGVSRTCTLTIMNVGQPLDYAVYFNERATTATDITTEHTPMENALLALIHGASTSVDVALYGLDRRSFVDALIAAYNNEGVTVRVVGDDDAATGAYSSSYQALMNAGITVITDTSTSKIQHNKFLIFDSQAVWTGSTNFTDTGLTLNANNSIVITDTTLAGVYTTEFAEMWAGSFHEDKTDNTLHLLDYNGTGLETYFSPTDLAAFEVWDELANADETIHFAIFFWTDDLLTDQVMQRLEAGVEVYGVWDELGAANPYSADEALCNAGARIKVEDFAGKVHHKFAVIDVEGSDPTVILGSYNWTSAGAYDNDENTLIIHDRDLARAYYAEWQRLRSALGVEDMCNPLVTYLPLVLKNGG
jgi:phosphatidylserine/phosphatidylglycerophosphate/cardiolipin synthase-like enzyme